MDSPSPEFRAAVPAEQDAPTETFSRIPPGTPPGEPPPGGGEPAAQPPRRPSRRGLALSAVGIVLVAGLAGWGATSNRDLTAHRATLAATQTELAAARTSLSSTKSTLDTTNASLATVSADRAAREKDVAGLSAQVAAETACIALQEQALAEVDRITELETANFNRTTEKSAWSKAEAARGKAISAALDAYYKAYSNAFQGRTSVARTYVSKGQAAQAQIAAEAKKQAAELKTVDESAAEIEKAIDALADQLAETERSCAQVTE